MDDSIAIWYEGEKKNVKADIHFNFWKLKSRLQNFGRHRTLSLRRKRYVLDIGIQVYEIQHITGIYLYLPIMVQDEDLLDLGELMHGDHSIVDAIFNEIYSYEDSKEHSNRLDVRNTDESDLFSILKYDVSDIETKRMEKGTRLYLPLAKFGECNGKAYIRIRCTSRELIDFTCRFRPTDRIFQPAVSEAEIYDIRINERRNIPEEIEHDFQQTNIFDILKLHFLIMRDADENLIPITQSAPPRTRQLEKRMWLSYLADDYKYKDMIAYHWKFTKAYDKPVESVNILAKFQYRRANLLRIVIYLIVAMILSVSFNLTANLVQNKIDTIRESIIDKQIPVEENTHENPSRE